MLLLGEGEAEFGGHLLLALPRYLGDRSYSLYLVHWPIVVFYSYATSQEVTLGTSIGLVAVTLALGEISFQVAERRSLFAPGRRENKAAVHPALVYSLLGFSSLMITVQNLDGMPSRLQSKVAEAAESEEQTWRLVEKFKPIAGYGRTQTIVPTETPIRYRVLVLGDSHAGQLKGMGTYFSMKYGVEWTTYSGGGCPPVFEYYRIYSVSRVSPLHRQERCRKLASSWRLFIEQNNAAFDLVILSSRWNQIFDHDKYLGKPYRNDALVPVSVDHEELVQQYAREPEQVMLQSQNNLIAGLKDTVQFLDDNNMGVFVFSQVPLNRADADFCGGVPDYFFDNADVDERCAGPLREAVLKRGEFMETLVRSGALNPATGVVVSDAFCAEDAERCIYMHEGVSLFKDDNHLNPVGAQFLARWWEAQSGFPF